MPGIPDGCSFRLKVVVFVSCNPWMCAWLCLRSYEDQNLTSLNTGAVEVFNLDFLSFRFDRLNYSVLEGDTLR